MHSCFSRDNGLLAMDNFRGPLQLIDVKTGTNRSEKWDTLTALKHATAFPEDKALFTFEFRGEGVLATAWSLDGTLRGGQTVTDKVRHLYSAPVSQGRKKMAIAHGFGVIEIVDLASMKIEHKIALGKDTVVGSFSLAADDKTLAVVQIVFLSAKEAKGSVKIFREGKEHKSLPLNAGRVGLSPDGSLLAVGTDEEFALYDVESGKKLGAADKTFRLGSRPPQFRGDGKLVYCLDAHGKIGEIEAPSGKNLRTFGKDNVCLAVSPVGKFLAAGDYRGAIVLWDLETGKEAFTLKGHRGHIQSLQFDAELGLLVSASGDNTALVWDMKALGVK
jgi:WD40 repeat protein